MRTKLWGAIVLAIASTVLLSPSQAHAQHAQHAQNEKDREAARRLMDEGDRLVEQQHFEEALRLYERAHAIMHVPTTGIDVALTLTNLGRLIEAREVALDVARLPGVGTESKVFAEARKDASELADRLVAKIPTVRIELPNGVEPTSVHASIDGEDIPAKAIAIPKRLNPGKHTIRVELIESSPDRDRFPFYRDVQLKEADRVVMNADFRGGGSSSSSTSSSSVLMKGDERIFGLSPLAAGGLGASALGLVLGSITGLVSINKAADAKTQCGPDPKNCDPAAESSISTSKTLGWIATASFALAIGGGAVATYALVREDKSKASNTPSKKVDVRLTAGGAFVEGTF